MSKLILTESEINNIIFEEVRSVLIERNPNISEELLEEGIVEFFKKYEPAIDGILMIIGLFPGYGDIADVILAAKDFYKGDYISGILSIIAAFPGLGSFARAAQIAVKVGGVKGLKNFTKILDYTVAARGALVKSSDSASKTLKSLTQKLTKYDKKGVSEFEKEIREAVPNVVIVKMLDSYGYSSLREVLAEAGQMSKFMEATYGRFTQKYIPMFDVFVQMLRVIEDEIGRNMVSEDVNFNQVYDEINKQMENVVKNIAPSTKALLGILGGGAPGIARAIARGGIEATAKDVGATMKGLTPLMTFKELADEWEYDSPQELADALGITNNEEYQRYLAKAQRRGGFSKEDLKK